MGRDLVLLPVDFDNSVGSYSHTLLTCSRKEELFEEIDKIALRIPVNSDFSSYISRDENYEDSHYGITNTDSTGEPVMTVLVESLLQLASHDGVMNNQKNKAIWTYLAALPLFTKVALFWN